MEEFDLSLAVGANLSRRYVITKPLYQTVDGGYYLAEDSVLKQTVCLKVLNLEQMQDSAVLARIQQEARIMVRCENPAFVKMSNFGISEDGRAYLASEFIDGIKLDSFLIGRAPLQFEEAFPFIAKLCDALDYAHNNGILLREIKPDSILLSVEEAGLSIKLSNLSAAVFKADFDDELSSSARPTIFNKNGCFSSPEFLLGKSINERSDLFSLGCICYFMLCGIQKVLFPDRICTYCVNFWAFQQSLLAACFHQQLKAYLNGDQRYLFLLLLLEEAWVAHFRFSYVN